MYKYIVVFCIWIFICGVIDSVGDVCRDHDCYVLLPAVQRRLSLVVEKLSISRFVRGVSVLICYLVLLQ